MTFEELKHDLQNDYGRINFRETLMLRRAYDAGRNQNLEEWKVLEKNYDDLYERTRWHFPAKGEQPADAGAKLVLLDFGSLGKEYGIRENLNTDVQKDVVAWCEIIPPKEEANDSKEIN